MTMVDAKELRTAASQFEKQGRLSGRAPDFVRSEVCYNLAAERDALESFVLIHLAARIWDGHWKAPTLHSAAWYLQEASQRFERIATTASFYLYGVSLQTAERQQQEYRQSRLQQILIPTENNGVLPNTSQDPAIGFEKFLVATAGLTTTKPTTTESIINGSNDAAANISNKSSRSSSNSSKKRGGGREISSDSRQNPRSAHQVARHSQRYHTALVTVGVLLADPRNPAFDLERSTLLLELGHCRGLPHATFWYGRALKNGVACVANVELGWQLMQQAATQGVRRALLEMGLVYETGYLQSGVVVRQNLPLAYSYFQVVAATASNPQSKSGQRSSDQSYQQQPHELMVTYEDDFLQTNPHGQQSQDWNESSINGPVQAWYWDLVIQVVLLLAAANLAPNTSNISRVAPDHYAVLLFLLPVLGLLVAGTSLWTLVTHSFVHQHRRDHLRSKMFTAKRRAIQALVGRSRSMAAGPPEPKTIVRMMAWGERLRVFVIVAFMVVWFVLLVNEFELQAQGDSEWWTG